MAGRQLVLCEALCFLINRFKNTEIKYLKSVLKDYFSIEDISTAKCRLLDDTESLNTTRKPPHVARKREGENRLTREVDDIFVLLNFLDENMLLEKLPMYVTDNPDHVPSFRLFEGDLKFLMQRMERLEDKVGTLFAAILSEVNNLCKRQQTPSQPGVTSQPSSKVQPIQPRFIQPNDDGAINHRAGPPTGNVTGARKHGESNDNTAVATTSSAAAPSQSASQPGLIIDDREFPPLLVSGSWAAASSTPVPSKDNKINNTVTFNADNGEVSESDQPFEPVRSRKRRRGQQYPAENGGQQSNGSQSVTRQQTPSAKPDRVSRRPLVVGKPADKAFVGIAAAKRSKSVFCIDNVNNLCSAEDIFNFVTDLGVSVVSCFEVAPRGSKRRQNEQQQQDQVRTLLSELDKPKAFRLCILTEDRERLLVASSWPSDIRIYDWFFKPKKNAEGGTNRRISESTSKPAEERLMNTAALSPVRTSTSPSKLLQQPALSLKDTMSSVAPTGTESAESVRDDDCDETTVLEINMDTTAGEENATNDGSESL